MLASIAASMLLFLLNNPAQSTQTDIDRYLMTSIALRTSYFVPELIKGLVKTNS